ncbi:MAG TPA: bifunctional phosphoribosylaminoimidazolecarboxamide formyltransferase/IMP cyclohydrolase, partial [Actinomycetes bacterium]|nr:bifunctional phosphoribosylaminoimidazolecarboxamide formyltransferase/IMP cyclohydrolase [Actinomycetes bacterium]
MSGTRLPIRRALVSVFDKQGLERLAAALSAAGVEVVSTGSTAAALEGHGLAVTRVEELTGFPELLDGRVKTLHPSVHAGLLADRSQPGHRAELDEAGIAPFDLVVVNLYPFEETVATPEVDPALAVERIDIGGPAMVRAAAKNHAWVAVVCDPADYPQVETALTSGGTTPAERRDLAAKAFARTAAYDTAVATWMTPAAASGGFPERLAVGGRLRQILRYGENPHQSAAFYAADGPGGPWGLGAARQLAGKELSYNNLLDADAALALVAEHGERPFATIVKHTNPCGAAFGSTLEEAYAGALDGDPVSAFGGVVGLSRPLDAATAKRVASVFTEVVVAPGLDDEALAVLAGKPSLRLVQVDPARPAGRLSVRSVAGGLLAQEPDPGADDPAGWDLEAGDRPGPELLADLAL